MREWIRVVVRAADHAAGWLLLSICLLNLAAVVMRYVFRDSISWSEEGIRYLAVWMTFLGSAMNEDPESSSASRARSASESRPASGDPTSDAIVIWTRVTPTGRNYPGGVDPPDDITFDVRWTVATAPPRGPADDAVDAASAERDDDGTWGSSETAVGVDADAAAWGFPRGSIVKTGTIAGVRCVLYTGPHTTPARVVLADP